MLALDGLRPSAGQASTGTIVRVPEHHEVEKESRRGEQRVGGLASSRIRRLIHSSCRDLSSFQPGHQPKYPRVQLAQSAYVSGAEFTLVELASRKSVGCPRAASSS